MIASVALIVAAGRGLRFGSERPKQYQLLGGRPVLRHALEAFARHPRIGAVAAVIHPDDRELFDSTAAGLVLEPPVMGGANRQGSVRNGLEAIAGHSPARVLIHDGARPLVSSAVIDRVLDALETHDGAVPALPVADTLKREDDGLVAATVDRAGLWRAQTPQGFRYDAIRSAHRDAAGQELTDDAAVAEAAGLSVALVPGARENLKITGPDDMAAAERWITGESLDTCCGNGFDVHRFGAAEGAGSTVHLCGVPIAHDRALLGHSDADVGLHAITDAVLGALGEGDIGSHFPPSDPKWKGAPSRIFLETARDLVRGRGGRIVHVDLTLVCESPKVGPHRDAMRNSVAAILGLNPARVSVKATTTEGLGFTGRGEGIAAQATASIQLPKTEL